MAQLHITLLECNNRQDTINQDTVVFQINGTTISGPHTNMVAGDTVNLDVRRNFTGTVAVTLLELDNTSADDLLGTEMVSDTLAGQGDQRAHFHLANARYHAVYHVHP